MFKMIIEIDWERMKRDGMDIEACQREFDEIMEEVPEVTEEEKGVFVTDDFGIHSYMMDLLDECEWFLKYVCKWIWISPTETDNVITSYNEIGIRCCYE